MNRHHLSRTLAMPLAIGLGLSTLAACTSSGGSSGGGTVTIGSVNSLTGTSASSGTDVQHGEDLALQIINGDYPNLKVSFGAGKGLPKLGGKTIKMKSQDDTGSPQTASTAVNTLVTQDRVSAIVGGYSSSVTGNASQQAERLQVPFVNGSSSADSLTTRGLKWFFRVGPGDKTFTTTMFQLLAQEGTAGKQVKKVAILHTNDTYGNGVEQDAKAAATSAGDQVVADIAYDETTTDLSPEIIKLRRANPDVLFDSSYTSDALLLMRGMKSLGWYPQAMLTYGAGFSDPTFLPTLGATANDVMSRAAWSEQLKNASSQAIAKMFQSKYKTPMTENSVRGFESVMAVATAINDAKSTDPSAVRDALEKVNIPASQLIAPWGGITFDSHHQNSKASGIVQQVQGGSYKVVFPADVAVAKVTWPMAGAR